MSERACPSREQLSAFVLGGLPDSALELIAHHLDDCPACEGVVLGLDQVTDPLLAELRRAGPASKQAQVGAEQALPERVGDYRLLREVGRGGMGVVYEAEQVSLGRRVALKVLARHALLDVASVERFRREARAAARLHHTNIVPVFETGEEGGLYYYAMQFIPGAGLDAIIRELRRARPASAADLAGGDALLDASVRTLLTGRIGAGRAGPAGATPAPASGDVPPSPTLPEADFSSRGRAYWANVARLGTQVAEALAYAHAQGLVHRDIKPSNLLVGPEGTVWVTDFGLAKVATDGEDLTRSGDLIGTLRYAPPERFQGQSDARGDVYGLGLTLYELLTLRAAFPEADRGKLLQQVMHSEPPRPRLLEPNLPRDLETVVLTAIARDPAQRYQTAGDLADDLRRFLDDRPIRARRATRAERLVRWCRRDPVTAGLVAGLLLVLFAGLLGVASLWRRAADKALFAERAEEKARANLYLSQIAQARLEWRLNNSLGAQLLLDRCEPARRGWEWHYLNGVNHADLFAQEHPDLVMVSGLAFSPDGRFLASGRWKPYTGKEDHPERTMEVWDVAARQRVAELVGPKAGARCSFSPDGKWLVASGPGGHAWLYEAGSWQERRVWKADGEVVFDRDGKRLAAGGHGAVTVWDTSSGAVVSRWPSRGGRVAFSRDGKHLAVSGVRAVELWDVKTGRTVRKLEHAQADANTWSGRFFPEEGVELAFSPDGQFLVTATSPPIVWEVATGRQSRRLTGHTGKVPGVAFSPDGRVVATVSTDSTVRLWDVLSGEGRETLLGHEGRVGCVCFHPDGWCLATGGWSQGDVKVWDLTNPPEHRALVRADAQALRFADDGRRLQLVNSLGALESWGVESGRAQRVGGIDFTREWMMLTQLTTFSGDGRRLAAVSRDRRVVKVWDAGTGKEVATLRGHTTVATYLALSRDGGRVASSARDRTEKRRYREVRVWDGSTGEGLAELRPHVPAAPGWHGVVALSPDGARVVFDDYVEGKGALEASVRICEAVGGRELLKVPVGDALIRCLTFSEDGARLAASDAKGRIVIWDKEGRRLHDKPAEGPGLRLAFSPDGQRLAGVDREQVKIWEVATGQEVLLLRGAPLPFDVGFNPTLAWSADGQRLAATTWDEAVNVWDASERVSEGARAALWAAARARSGAWHLREAEAAAGARQAFGAAFHMRRAGSEEAGRKALVRAGLFLLTGEWDKAAQDYAVGFEGEGPHQVTDCLGHARTLILRGEDAKHRRLCARMVAQFGDNPHSEVLAAVARACALGRAGGDPKVTVRLARQRLKIAPGDTDALFTLGLAEHRAGAWGEAVARLEESTEASPETAWVKWPALALAEHGRGDRRAAERWLTRAEEWAKGPGRAEGAGLALGGDWVDFQVLVREAVATLRGPNSGRGER